LKDWLKNHSRASASSGEGRRSILDLRTRKTRKLSVQQAYSKLFYESKLKKIVQEHWKAAHPPNEPLPPPTLKFRNSVMQNLFNDEPQDIKDKVNAERDQSGQEESIEPDGDDPELDQDEDEVRRIKNARQYQTYVCRWYSNWTL
jgi:hypothetical protein